MFDFRYHALSLVAVFLALGIGILLGVTIGDSLVSQAEKDVRSSLRGDVVQARDDAQRVRSDLAKHEAALDRLFPAVVEDRLGGERVALVAFGSLPDEVESPVRQAVEGAGGRIDSTSLFGMPPDERELGDAVGGKFERLGSDTGLLRRLGVRVGRGIASGSPVARRLARRLPDAFRGDYRGADAVVVYRAPRDEQSDTAVALERALIEGLSHAGVPVVGVERTNTDPSQVSFYQEADLSSVDDVDDVLGRIALVFALQGARGAFGLKDSADEPVPEPPGMR